MHTAAALNEDADSHECGPYGETKVLIRLDSCETNAQTNGSTEDQVATEETGDKRRVLLKLSGEVFGGGAIGLDPQVLEGVAAQIASAVHQGVEVAVVVGGGNFYRGAELAANGLDRARADYMGMLGTVVNALALQDFLERQGIETRVQTAIQMTQIAEPYLPLRAMAHMTRGKVVIFGAGSGMPYFSTDTVAAQRALETHCDELLIAKNGVDGVYTADPRTDPEAKLLENVTYEQALSEQLKVVDAAAFALGQENNLTMRVFGMNEPGNITKALMGERIGTLVTVETKED